MTTPLPKVFFCREFAEAARHPGKRTRRLQGCGEPFSKGGCQYPGSTDDSDHSSQCAAAADSGIGELAECADSTCRECGEFESIRYWLTNRPRSKKRGRNFGENVDLPVLARQSNFAHKRFAAVWCVCSTLFRINH